MSGWGTDTTMTAGAVIGASNLADRVVKIPLNKISTEERARQRPINRAGVAALKADLKLQGLLQPIGVVPLKDSGNYKLVWGLHRYTAFHELHQEGLHEGIIPAILLRKDATPDELLAAEIAENLKRTGLTRAQVDAMTLTYAGLVRKLSPVVSAKETRVRKAAGLSPTSGRLQTQRLRRSRKT